MVKQVVYKPTSPASQKNNTPIIQQKEFSPNLCEWASKNREQVYPSVTATSSSATLYIVPQGFTLYITSAYLSCVYSGGVTNLDEASIYTGTRYILRAYKRNDAANDIPSNLSCSFPMPLKIESGTTILFLCGCTGYGGFSGFLEQNQAN